MKLGQNVFLDESCTNLKMGHVGSKYRSQGPILEKPFVCSKGHIFSPIIMKFGQNIFLDELLDLFENGSSLVKNEVYRSNVG